MSYQVVCDASVDKVSTAGEAWQLLVDYMGMVFPHGRRAFTMFLGEPDTQPVLRLDVDADAGRAAATWVPDGSTAAESGVPPCHVDLSVCESSDRDPVTVPAEQARVTPGAALALVEEYVTTGQRPTCVTWRQ